MMDDPDQPGTRKRTKSSGAVTLQDVARAGGVTVGTASKALNGRGKLRDETRARVQAVAEELGFSPNDLAHSLHRGRSFTVGLVTTDSYGRFSIPVLTGIEDALWDASITVFLCNTLDDPERERSHVRALLSKRVDGLIVTAWRTDPRPPLSRVGDTPIVYAYAHADDPDACCFVPDDAQGGELATHHLLEVGRRHLAHVTGPNQFEAVQQRRDAMRRTVANYGVDVPDERILYGPWSETWGYEAGMTLLRTDPRIDGIFCGSDEIARGVLAAAGERGFTVPDDLSIVGFDNWEILANGARPPLTSIDMKLRDLGKRAGEALVSMIDGGTEQGTTRLPCSLVVRGSSRPRPAEIR
jgi:LacI family transcriptional regulator